MWLVPVGQWSQSLESAVSSQNHNFPLKFPSGNHSVSSISLPHSGAAGRGVRGRGNRRRRVRLCGQFHQRSGPRRWNRLFPLKTLINPVKNLKIPKASPTFPKASPLFRFKMVATSIPKPSPFGQKLVHHDSG